MTFTVTADTNPTDLLGKTADIRGYSGTVIQAVHGRSEPVIPSMSFELRAHSGPGGTHFKLVEYGEQIVILD